MPLAIGQRVRVKNTSAPPAEDQFGEITFVNEGGTYSVALPLDTTTDGNFSMITVTEDKLEVIEPTPDFEQAWATKNPATVRTWWQGRRPNPPAQGGRRRKTRKGGKGRKTRTLRRKLRRS